MKKALIGKAWCKGKPINYYLLVEKLENEMESYGISVEYMGEIARISAIAMSLSQINRFIQTLQDGCVTPITAQDIVDDWILDPF